MNHFSIKLITEHIQWLEIFPIYKWEHWIAKIHLLPPHQHRKAKEREFESEWHIVWFDWLLWVKLGSWSCHCNQYPSQVWTLWTKRDSVFPWAVLCISSLIVARLLLLLSILFHPPPPKTHPSFSLCPSMREWKHEGAVLCTSRLIVARLLLLSSFYLHSPLQLESYPPCFVQRVHTGEEYRYYSDKTTIPV